MKQHYHARDYHPNRRISLASGCILGTPTPLPPLERPITFKGDRRRSPAFAEKMRAIVTANWARRKAR